jgi:hypothetical protein
MSWMTSQPTFDDHVQQSSGGGQGMTELSMKSGVTSQLSNSVIQSLLLYSAGCFRFLPITRVWFFPPRGVTT